MPQADRVAAVDARLGRSPHDGRAAVAATLQALQEVLAHGEPVKMVAFGRFRVRQNRARGGRHPQPGHATVIPPRRGLTGKPRPYLRDAVQGAKAPSGVPGLPQGRRVQGPGSKT
jgi:nucleoid DNA-binding protein